MGFRRYRRQSEQSCSFLDRLLVEDTCLHDKLVSFGLPRDAFTNNLQQFLSNDFLLGIEGRVREIPTLLPFFHLAPIDREPERQLCPSLQRERCVVDDRDEPGGDSRFLPKPLNIDEGRSIASCTRSSASSWLFVNRRAARSIAPLWSAKISSMAPGFPAWAAMTSSRSLDP